MKQRVHVLTVVCLLLLCSPYLTQVKAYEVLVWFHSGCQCSYSVSEESGSREVCAEILYINGTDMTSSNYTVTISADMTTVQPQFGIDFFLAPTNVTFPAGSERGDRQCVTVSITNDEAVEDTETVPVQLSTDDDRVELSSLCSRALFHIGDTDVITVGLLESTINVTEMAGSVQLCMNVTHGNVESSAVIRYSTSSGSAVGNQDFSSVISGSVLFSSGVAVGDVRCVSVNIVEDTRVENDEEFIFSLQNYINTQVARSEGSTLIRILDNDVATIGMEVSNIAQFEDSVTISVCVILIDSMEIEIPVLSSFVSTQPVTATETSDYDGLMNFPINFFSGDVSGTRRCAIIVINEDSIVENDETFNVILTESSERLLIEAGADITEVMIIEDGDFVNIGWSSSEYTTVEDATMVRVCAQIDSGALERDVLTSLSTLSGGSATANMDYPSVDFIGLSFTSGQSSSNMPLQCAELDIINDSTLEGDETFAIRLLSRSDPVIITSGGEDAQVVIREDNVDNVIIGFPSVMPLDVMEGSSSTVMLCPHILFGTLERTVSVVVSTMDITARASFDYTAIVGAMLHYTSTDSIQCVPISILNDNNVLEDPMETFQATVSSASGSVVLIPPIQETVVITIHEDTSDRITVGFQQTSHSTPETGGPLSICVQMFAGSLERNVSLHVMSTDGSANDPVDYMSFGVNTQIVFSIGQSTGSLACVNLDIIDDNVVEMDEETLSLSLFPENSAVTSVVISSANVVILENDNDVDGSITLTSSHYDAYESNEMVRVCAVIMAEALERQVTVQLSSQDVSARNFQDYVLFQLPFEFFSGASAGDEVCHEIAITDDNILENDEMFIVRLTSSEPAFLGGNLTAATVTILHDPSDYVELGFVRDHYVVSELDVLRNETICLEINTGSLEREVVVNLAVNDTSAEGGVDYVGPIHSTLTFIPGQTVGAQRCTSISVIDDSLIEDDETFIVAAITNEESVRFAIGENTITVTILEDPNDRVVIQMLNSTISGSEGEVVSVCAELISIAGGLRRPITVTLETLNGTAELGADYISSVSTPLMFPPGSDEEDIQCTRISLILDIAIEEAENFIVELLSSDTAVVIPATFDITIITIIDVLSPQAVAVSLRSMDTNFTVTEGTDFFFVFCVDVVIGTVSQFSIIELQPVDGSAKEFADYNIGSSALQFVPGSHELCESINIHTDFIVEADERFSVVLFTDSDIQIINGTINVTILDDPANFVTVGLRPVVSAVRENETFLVCAELVDGYLERDVFVGLLAKNGSAMQGIDFIGPDPSIVTFTSGQSTGDIQCANVTILDNSVVNGQRRFSISLTDNIGFGGGGVRIDAVGQSIDIDISIDMTDVIIVGLSSMSYQVTEAPNAVVSVCATIQLGSVGRDIAVLLVTPVFGPIILTAAPGLDFVPISETIVFTDGQSMGDSVCTNITIIQDVFVEMQEMFEVNLLQDSFAAIIQAGKDRSIVTISDGDQYRSVSVQPSTPNVVASEEAKDNGSPQAMVCLELASGNLQRDVSIRVMTSSSFTSTALVDRDYLYVDVIVTFTSGQNSTGDNQQCVFIPLVDDMVLEGNETFDILINTTVDDEDNIVNVTSQVITVTIEEDPNDFVEVGFLPLNSTVSENETFPVCVELTTGTLERNATVPLQIESTSALENVDFIGPNPSILTFTSGQTVGGVQCATISIVDDTFPQGERNFSITIRSGGDSGSDGNNGVLVNPTLSSVMINIRIDLDDVIFVGLSSLMYQASEGPNAVATVCATIDVASRPLGRNTSVVVMAAPLTEEISIAATPILDFVPLVNELTFTLGQSVGDSSCVDIMIVQDVYVEESEKFEVQLLPNPNDLFGAIIQPNRDRATVTISDGEMYQDVNIGPAVLNFKTTEGGDIGVQVMVCLELERGNLQRNVTMEAMTILSPISTATVNEDYLEVEMSITFTSGQNASGDNQQCFSVPVLNDNILECNETFEISLSPISDDEDIVNITNSVFTVTIEEDPSDFVEVGVLPFDRFVTENETFSICVEITNGLLGCDTIIPLEVVGGSAIKGVDFIGPTPSTLLFTSGQTLGDIQCARITILDDFTPQGERNFAIAIGSGGGTVGDGDGVRVDPSALFTVINIQFDAEDRLSQLTYESREGPNAIATVCAMIEVASGPISRDMIVLAVTPITGPNITATPFVDFVPIENELTFTEGHSVGDSACTDITIIQDIFVEAQEIFEVLLLPNPSNILGPIIQPTKARATVIISDGDANRIVNIKPSKTNLLTVEGGDEVMVCLELMSGNLQRNITLTARTISSETSTATVNEDYLDVEISITFTSGQNASGDNQQCFFVPILNDNILECNETFEISLTPISDNEDIVNITNSIFTVTIEEDPSDYVEIGLLPLNRSVTESETFTVCVQIAAGLLGCDITVPIEVQGSSVLEGVDFIGPTPSTLLFTSGQTVRDIQCAEITILDDFTPQGERNLIVAIGSGVSTVGNGDGVRVDPNALSIHIDIDVDIDDYIVVGMSQLTYQAREGPNATATVCVTIEVAAGPVSRDTVVYLFTPITGVPITATPTNDFIPITDELTFTEGHSVGDSVCSQIRIVQDIFVEYEEIFEVMLLPDVNDPVGAIIAPTRNKAIVTISDGEMNRNVEVQPSLLNILTLEGISGGDSAQMMVCIELASGYLQRNVTVNVMAVPSPTSTASVNEDYLDVEMNVTFTSGQNASGDNQQCFSFPILNDNILECNETFDILISPVPEDEAVVNITSDIITVIIEEDPNDYIEVGLLPLNRSFAEGESFPVCVQITAGVLGCDIAVTLEVSTQDSIVEGVDYIGPTPLRLLFTTGQSVGTIHCAEITVVDDSVPQKDRSFNVSIGTNSGTISDSGDVVNGRGVGINPDQLSVVVNIDIDLNDLIQVGFADIMYVATEGPNTQANICVNIEAGSTTSNVTLHLMTPTSGALTATPVLDFTPISEVLTFTLGQSVGDSVCTQIVIVEDDYVEYVETFEVVLLPTLEDSFKVLIVSGKERATVTISDGERGSSVVIAPSLPLLLVTEGKSGVAHLNNSEQGNPTGIGGDSTLLVMACAQLLTGNLQRNVTLVATTFSSPTSTATENEDYVVFEMSVVFVSGQNATGDNEQCFYVTILDDDVLEGNETFDILIRPTPEDEDIVNITGGIITVTIKEDPTDRVRIGLTNTRFVVTESVDPSITVCAELEDGSLERNVSLLVFSTPDSNATSGTDYLISMDVLTFTSGQFSFDGILQCFVVEILNDQDTEHRETLMITIVPDNSSAEVVIIPTISSVVSINILEDPADEVQLSPLDSVTTVTEGDDVMMCVQVSTGSLQRDIQLVVKTLSGPTLTAMSGLDFTDIMTTLTISSNQPTCTNLTILNDNILEGCEAFFVAFEVDPNFSGVAAIPRDADKSVIIIEDDLKDGVEVGFTQSNLISYEDESQPTEVCIEVTSGILQRNVSVHLETVNKSLNEALLDLDFGIEKETLILGPSVPIACASIVILDDDLLESTEMVSLFLTPSLEDAAVINFSNQEATLQIMEDLKDGVTMGLSQVMFTVKEGENSVQVCAELLNGELGTNISLSIEARDDSAISGKDYSGLPGTPSFESGQTTGALSCINITIIDDSMVEDVENFSFVLRSDFPGVSVSKDLGVVEIIDNDEVTTMTSSSTASLAVMVAVPTVLIPIFIFVLLFMIFLILFVLLIKRRQKKGSNRETSTMSFQNPSAVVPATNSEDVKPTSPISVVSYNLVVHEQLDDENYKSSYETSVLQPEGSTHL